jgi:tetratricopeptide (TPR) repeat protein
MRENPPSDEGFSYWQDSLAFCSVFQYDLCHMTMTRGRIIGGIITLVIIAVAVYAVWYFASAQTNKYQGLVTHLDAQMDDNTRVFLTQRLKTTEAAVAAAKEKGEDVSLNLYLSIASDAYSLGDLVTAREAVELQLRGNAAHYGAWNTYGTVLEAMGDYDKALEAYKKAIDLGAKAEEFYRDYITLFAIRYPEDKNEVKRILDLSLAERGQSAWSMVQLARWYKEDGNCAQANDHYKVAVALAPSNTELAKEAAEAKSTCK